MAIINGNHRVGRCVPRRRRSRPQGSADFHDASITNLEFPQLEILRRWRALNRGHERRTFLELLQSVSEMKAIRSGKVKPSRSFTFDTPAEVIKVRCSQRTAEGQSDAWPWD